MRGVWGGGVGGGDEGPGSRQFATTMALFRSWRHRRLPENRGSGRGGGGGGGAENRGWGLGGGSRGALQLARVAHVRLCQLFLYLFCSRLRTFACPFIPRPRACPGRSVCTNTNEFDEIVRRCGCELTFSPLLSARATGRRAACISGGPCVKKGTLQSPSGYYLFPVSTRCLVLQLLARFRSRNDVCFPQHPLSRPLFFSSSLFPLNALCRPFGILTTSMSFNPSAKFRYTSV